MDEAKICENCKYYRKHYFLFKGRFTATFSGHCITNRNRPSVKFNQCCNKWELAENRETRQAEDIKKILLRAAKQINEIAKILKTKD